MKRMIVNILCTGLFFLISANAVADQVVNSVKVKQGPVVDGKANDSVWKKAREVVTHDRVAKIDIHIKTVYTRDEIFFLIRFPDSSENRQHKSLSWDKQTNLYNISGLREDTFVFKWNMEPFPVDISLTSDSAYKADIWYWKSFRTDHVGYADDKYQIYSNTKLKKAHKVFSKTGRGFYLIRKGDKGLPAYKNYIPVTFKGDSISGYHLVRPEGSRADVRAKGRWKDGLWTIEFSRKLNTNHVDDVYLEPGNNYYFGISRYEIAGRTENPAIENPLYGSGDIGEQLTLKFKAR